jgi:D-3-phosphoglycerate dehydrogenase
LANSLDPLILDLLEWIGPGPRPYSEVIDAWRTSCPRLTVWEDASERGFVERRHEPGNGALVCVTALGFNFLAMHRRASASTLECSQDD